MVQHGKEGRMNLNRKLIARSTTATLALLIAMQVAAVARTHVQDPPATESAALHAPSTPARSIRTFDVLPENPPELNKQNLQKAIDWASTSGSALFVEPSADPYHVAPGIILKRNVSLIGVHGPVGRGTKHAEKAQPVGSVFQITGTSAPFITVESSTQISGIQFWYSDQTLTDPAKIIEYPPTIRVSQDSNVWGVTLRSLTFYGEFLAMDFRSAEGKPCEQILIEHCYGYPLGGEFIRIDRCYDVPRILHCHVNPATMRAFAGDFRKAVVDSVIARGTYAFRIDRTDNAQLMDLFTFGTFGGAFLGPATYGQLTSFNFDCVTVGIFKDGDSKFNRNWMIAQGSIIANVGRTIDDIHPVIIQGEGHAAISNVEAFSGPNGAVSALGKSADFLLVRGEGTPTITMSGCRMRNYERTSPLTIENTNAKVIARMCIDTNEQLFEH